MVLDQLRPVAVRPDRREVTGDEFWTGAGHLAAIRPDGHRPQLIEHHTRLLTALVGALAAGY